MKINLELSLEQAIMIEIAIKEKMLNVATRLEEGSRLVQRGWISEDWGEKVWKERMALLEDTVRQLNDPERKVG